MSFNVVFKSSRSLTFELDNKNPYFASESYDVVIDGKKVLTDVKENVTSVYDLNPGQTYEVKINGKTEKVTTLEESAVVNVKDFGAIGDGINDDTMAIQSAILSVPENGRVLIPEGTYHVRPIFLRSNLTIELVKGARLLGETDRYKYPVLPGRISKTDGTTLELASWEGTADATYASIITGVSVSNVKVIGEGIIDANGQNSDWWVDVKTKRGQWRPKGIFLSNCENIGFQGVTVTNTPSWNLHPYFSNYIDFIDMKLISPKDSPNTDGCDPESCEYVNVIGVNFSVGDDCIAIKSGKFEMGMKYRKPTSHMTVRNCYMAYGHGAVVLGSEMSGGIKDLSVTQCYFYKTDRGLRIKTRRGRGESAVIDGITFENIYMEEVLTPLVMNMFYYCDPDGKTEYVWSKDKLAIDDRTPYLGKFTFKDMKCVDAHAAGAFFYGLPEQPIKSITIENVDISFAKDAKPAIPAMMSFQDAQLRAGLQFRNVDHVELKNVNITGIDTDKHERIVLENVREFTEE